MILISIQCYSIILGITMVVFYIYVLLFNYYYYSHLVLYEKYIPLCGLSFYIYIYYKYIHLYFTSVLFIRFANINTHEKKNMKPFFFIIIFIIIIRRIKREENFKYWYNINPVYHYLYYYYLFFGKPYPQQINWLITDLQKSLKWKS